MREPEDAAYSYVGIGMDEFGSTEHARFRFADPITYGGFAATLTEDMRLLTVTLSREAAARIGVLSDGSDEFDAIGERLFGRGPDLRADPLGGETEE